MSLSEKSALVLGGVGGIGQAVIDNFMSAGLKKIGVIDIVYEAKAREALNGVLSKYPGYQLAYERAEVEDEDDLRSAMRKISRKLDGLDIVVNSAGVLNENDPKKTIMVNFLGTVNSTLIGIELMRKDKGGRGGIIMNIASLSAILKVFALSTYGATKHAILAYTQNLAASDSFHQMTGIHFMACLPGVTVTPLVSPDNVVNKFIFPEMIEEIKLQMGKTGSQEPDWVGKCVLEAVTEGKNGDVWQVENRIFRKVTIYDGERLS